MSERPACQHVLVSGLAHAERTASLLIETAEMIIKAEAWEAMYTSTGGKKGFLFVKVHHQIIGQDKQLMEKINTYYNQKGIHCNLLISLGTLNVMLN